MPFNPAVFKTRALTAVVFVAVMLTGLLWNGWSFFLLFTVIHFGCWHEYTLLMDAIHPDCSRVPRVAKILVMSGGWTAMPFAAGSLLPGLTDVVDSRFWLFMGILLLAASTFVMYRENAIQRNVLLVYAAGLAYISLSWALLVHLRSGSIWKTTDGAVDGFAGSMEKIGHMAGYAMPLILIATIWLNDTIAYLVGSLFGKTPLSPVSPKKTLEGTVGGILISVILVTLGASLSIGTSTAVVALLAAVTAIAGTFGDLLESKLKRMAGVKDSGHFMPGHGGFLDRFDSLLVATPFVWILCNLFLR